MVLPPGPGAVTAQPPSSKAAHATAVALNLRKALGEKVVGWEKGGEPAFIKNIRRFETSLFKGIKLIWGRGNLFQIRFKRSVG